MFTDAYDPGLTAIRGYGVESRLSREAGNWLWEINAGARSPGFENNDLAFLTRVDYVWMNANLIRRRTTPTWLFRDYALLVGAQQRYNFEGDRVGRSLRAYVEFTLRNYWSFSTFTTYQPATLDDQLTRGGPVVRYAARRSWQAQLATDSRKRLSASVGGSLGWNSEGARDRHIDADIAVRPATNVILHLAPLLDHWESTAQYVTAVDDPTATAFYGTRYVFADLTRRTLGMNVRLNVAFTPALTLDLYMQPLIVSGAYAQFKEFVQPRGLEKRVYGSDTGTIAASDGQYVVDPDGSGAAPTFTFDDPDFNFRSLRGNAVLRWEFRPGSTLYLVWTHQRSDQEPIGTMDLHRDITALLKAPADNVLLVKLSYWIGL